MAEAETEAEAVGRARPLNAPAPTRYDDAMQRIIELVQGNIVEQQVDAIVNAANERMLGGGGVDGAIHRAAGPTLLEACREVPPDEAGRRCPTGETRTTHAGDLPARYVIHGVGPIYDAARHDACVELLRAVHLGALASAAEHGCASVAFPAISCGVYAFPIDAAARIAIGTVRAWLDTHDGPVERVRFVLFSEADLAAFRAAEADAS